MLKYQQGWQSHKNRLLCLQVLTSYFLMLESTTNLHLCSNTHKFSKHYKYTHKCLNCMQTMSVHKKSWNICSNTAGVFALLLFPDGKFMNTAQKNIQYVNIPPFLHNRLTADHQSDNINGETDKWHATQSVMLTAQLFHQPQFIPQRQHSPIHLQRPTITISHKHT